ncbi:GGDEF domain-containing protein [Lacrimispora sp. 38-1]|uniref:GGDEF domain-containing protein n=1 Tax=Lacrimispora sp. 38-1 TaxID=3125778 RepID=UPI003CECFE80
MVIREKNRQSVIFLLVGEEGEILQMNISKDEYESMFLNVNLLEIDDEMIHICADDCRAPYKVTKTEVEVDNRKLIHFLFIDENIMESNKFARYVDIFTGLYNRNFWEEIMRKKIEISCEENFTVLIIDIDDLKRLNDGYGHMVGDEAIKAVSDALLYILNKNQYGIRFGGDEFVLILPDIKKREIENMMKKVSEIATSFFDSDKYIQELTFCYGYAKIENLTMLKKAFEKADVMMYQEKEKKRH